jgi:hypothetical protein
VNKKKNLNVFEITPEDFYCGIGACPSIFKTNRNTYLIVGSILDEKLRSEISHKIGEGEDAIEIPIELINDLKK